MALVFKSHRKDGESPFSECTIPISITKADIKLKDASWHILKENDVLLVHKGNQTKLTKASLLGFIASSRGLLQEESDLSEMRMSDGFDATAYKLMKRSSYDLIRPTSLGHFIKAKPYGLNSIQEIIQNQGARITTPKVGLDYVPPQPIRILG